VRLSVCHQTAEEKFLTCMGPRHAGALLVGQPILAAAGFQAAFFSLRAGLAKGTGGGFLTLSPAEARGVGPAKFFVL
jgi:hypothetical protein